MELRCQNRFWKFWSFGCAKFEMCSCYDCVPSISKIKTMMKLGFYQGIWISLSKIFYFTFEKLNFSSFWGPPLIGFAKFVEINHFHDWVTKGLTKFGCWFWNFHTLNYDSVQCLSQFFSPKSPCDYPPDYRNSGYGNSKISTQI